MLILTIRYIDAPKESKRILRNGFIFAWLVTLWRASYLFLATLVLLIFFVVSMSRLMFLFFGHLPETHI
jgi:hypothetical protein